MNYYSIVLQFTKALGIRKRDLIHHFTPDGKEIKEVLELRNIRVSIGGIFYTLKIQEVGKWIYVNPISKEPWQGKNPEIEFREYILKKGNKQVLRIDDDRSYISYMQGKAIKDPHLHIKILDPPKILLNLILRPQTCNAINFLMYLHYRQLTGEAPV